MSEAAARIVAHLNGTGQVVAERVVAAGTITYKGYRAQRERTGVHARVDVLINGAMAAWAGHMNIEDPKDRVYLAGKAISQFGPLAASREKGGWPKQDLETDLNDFCDQLWPVWNVQFTPELMGGSEERSATPMVVEGLVVEGGGSIAYAPPGRGKSYTFLLVAQSVNYGLNQLFRVPKAIPTLYVNLERNRESMRRRLGNVNDALGVDRDAPLHFLNARGKGLVDVYESVQDYIRAHDIGFVVLDSISRAGYAGSLTEDVSSNKITDALNGLGVTWAALAHTGWKEEHEYGSIMFRAAADVVIELNTEIKDDGTMGIGLRPPKSNDLGFSQQKQQIIGLSFDDKGLTGVWRSTINEFPELAHATKEALGNAVLDFLLQVGKASATEVAKETGLDRDDISRYLNSDRRFSKERQGRSVLYFVKETK